MVEQERIRFQSKASSVSGLIRGVWIGEQASTAVDAKDLLDTL
jgi:hypothetical protein